MRKFTIFKSLLLLCALVVGGSAWADETVTFTFNTDAGLTELGISKPSQGAGTDLSTEPYTLNFVSLTAAHGSTNTRVYNSSGSLDLRVYKNGGSLTLSAPGIIKSIVLTGSAVSNFSVPSGSFSSGTWTPAENSTEKEITLTATNTGKINTIAVTYTPGEKTDPTITLNDGSVRVGKTLDLSTLFTTNSNGAVTYSITSGGSYATIAGSTLTGVAEGDVTVQASQAATGYFNAKTATATISVIDPALSSIAITTAPTKTTYDEGEVFDATGMAVTATFANGDTEDVTASCTCSPSGALTTSDTEVTVSYTYKGVTKTATQDITVNAYVQPTSVTIVMDYRWLGSSNGNNLASTALPVVKSDDHVTTTITDGTSTRPRGDADYIRVYQGSTITFSAPAGYAITKLEFTTGGNNSWKDPTVSGGTLSSKTWTGNAASVMFSLSGSCFIASVKVTLSTTAKITLAAACTDGTNYYGTYSHGSAFVVPADLTVSTISVSGSVLTLTSYAAGDVVKANTGVLVSSSTSGEKTITLSAEAGTEKAGNMLKATGDANIKAAGMTVADTKFYRLTMHDGSAIGFWWGAADGAAFDLGANKAYLAVPAAAAARIQGFWFNGEASGIADLNRETMNNNRYYNLNGQRVDSPVKGLYIVNGKKVLVK